MIRLYPIDKNGIEIHQGMNIRHPNGEIGIVVFRHWAIRVELPGRIHTNETLLYCDAHKPEDFEVIR